MRYTVGVMLCALLLGNGCCWWDSHNWSAAGSGFRVGASRQFILRELEYKNAQVLNDTPELVLAEYQPADLDRPMRVELGFKKGRLAKVNYLPQ